MMKTIILFFIFIFSTLTHAADLESLSNLFKQNFNSYYEPRLCGKNIALLASQAVKRNIDLSNSYILKIEGAGFLETSGFYTRAATNDRAMLGYFHFVLIADGHVFDFDLAEPLILEVEDYVRLQFTPPYSPYVVFGIKYDPLDQLQWWKVSRYEIDSFLNHSTQVFWTKKMNQFVNLENVMNRRRIR